MLTTHKEKRLTLEDIIRAEAVLTTEQCEGLANLLGKRCHLKTKKRLTKQLILPICFWPYLRLASRFEWNQNTGWDYHAGQSYPDEIRATRTALLKG